MPGESWQDALREPRVRVLLAVGVIVLVVAVIYANSFRCAFVFDDEPVILGNPAVRDPLPLSESLLKSRDITRPVVWATLAANWALGQDNPRGYHAFNVAIHMLAALALLALAHRTFRTPAMRKEFGGAALPLAAAAALLWAAHPLNTQAVTYVVQRAESLMGLFYLLTLYLLARGAAGGRGRNAWYAGAVAACLLGMATKQVMVTAPIAALLYDRVFLSRSFRVVFRRRWKLHAALAGTWVLLIVLTAASPRGVSKGVAMAALSWWQYFRSQFGVILRYLWLAVCPAGLCMDYGWRPASTFWSVVGPMVPVLGLFALCVWHLARWRPWALAGFGFFLILAPTSSILPLPDILFEYRMYLPLACLAVLAVAAAYYWGRRAVERWVPQPQRRPIVSRAVAAGAVGLAVVALGAATAARNGVYETPLKAWQDTVDKAPDNPRAQYNLANFLERDGQLDAAIEHQLLAVAKAKQAYAREDRLLSLAYNNLGHLYARRGKYALTVQYCELSLRHKPDHARAMSNLGLALFRLGNEAEAEKLFRDAIRLDGRLVSPRINLGVLLDRRGDLEAAGGQFLAAIRNDPTSVRARRNLAATLARMGRYGAAAAHLRDALRIRPDDLDVTCRLAWLLATCPDAEVRDGKRAVELAQRALDVVGGRHPRYIDLLAAAQAEAGLYENAAWNAERAAKSAEEAGNQALAEEIRSRLALYRAGKPFHAKPR